MKHRVSLLFSVFALGACSLAPDYTPPAFTAPQAYKEDQVWVEAQPSDTLARGAWWKSFHDPALDALEEQAATANQDLKIAVAQYDQARAIAAQARSNYFPTLTGNASATRQQVSQNLANRPGVPYFNNFTLGADISYEIDLWGRVRNTVAANEDRADASAADLAGVQLSIQAELANTYFSLRGDDAAQDILDKTVEADQKAYDLTKRRFDGGIAAESDVDQAETQLENAKTQAHDMRLQRSQLEHALAVLIGKTPADFSLPPMVVTAQIPATKPGLPSTLLERRPDIAAAERRVSAANAEIGVARAAWFPALSLTGNIGFESASAANWFTAPSRFWSLGPSAVMTLLDGGAISALNDEARAAYDETVAAYRSTALVAYREVEDNLSALRHLAQEEKTQSRAAAAATRALTQANNRYSNGATTYLDVVVAQNAELQARLASNAIMTRRLLASVQLMKALGGGWNAPDIKTLPAISDKHP